nr:MAG TPA: hypothetical protein [Caudoviricetes sp.]
MAQKILHPRNSFVKHYFQLFLKTYFQHKTRFTRKRAEGETLQLLKCSKVNQR